MTVRWPTSVSGEWIDLASGQLFELGARGLEQRDGSPTELVASFDASTLTASTLDPSPHAASPPDASTLDASRRIREAFDGLLTQVEAALHEVGISGFTLQRDAWPEIDWSTHWRTHFRPLSFGSVWVVPQWLEAPPDAQVVLRIDPGMAFGTGLHPTTALCMERIVELAPITRMLDVGAGTGILSLGAAALGSATVHGIDIDPVSVEAAQENAHINGLTDRVEFWVASEVEGDELYDVVVANILAEPLIAMASSIVAKVAPGGRLLLSGVLVHQGKAVIDAYRTAEGFRGPPRRQERGEWLSIEFERVA